MRDIPASGVIALAQRVLAEAAARVAHQDRWMLALAQPCGDHYQGPESAAWTVFLSQQSKASKGSQDPIGAHLKQSLAALERANSDGALLATARAIADVIISALRSGNKILLIGNGGSAADAQHIAAEIIGRYKVDRAACAAVALTTDTSALTAIANDYGFEQVFARQVEGLGRKGDVLLALTTSGRSPNILAALHYARENGLVTVGFTGSKGQALGALCDHLLVAPTDDTPVVQQIYLAVAHGICDQIEQTMMREAAKK